MSRIAIKVILLGILAVKGPLTGYDIKKTLKEWHINKFVKAPFGSIYYHLSNMKKNGLVESFSENGKVKWKITNEGFNEFRILLKKIFFEYERIYYSFDVALMFMPFLSFEEIIVGLNNRIEIIRRILDYLYKVRDEEIKILPFFLVEIVEHSIAMLEAELKWLEKLKEKVYSRKNELIKIKKTNKSLIKLYSNTLHSKLN